MSLLRPRLVRDRMLVGLGLVTLSFGIGLIYSQLSITAVRGQFDRSVDLDQATTNALVTLERSVRDMLRTQTAYAINGGSDMEAAFRHHESLLDGRLDAVRAATSDDPQALRLTEIIEHDIYRWIGEVAAAENSVRRSLDESSRRLKEFERREASDSGSFARLGAAIASLEAHLLARGEALRRLREVEERLAAAHADYQTYLGTGSPSMRSQLLRQMFELSASVNLLRVSLAAEAPLTASLSELVAAHEVWETQNVEAGMSQRLEHTRVALSAGELSARVYRNRDSELFRGLFGGLDRLQERLRTRTAERQAAAARSVHTSYFTSIAAALSALLVGIYWLRRTTRAVSEPIEQLGAGFRKIGAGTADFRVSGRYPGELGELIDAFNSMAERLNRNTVSRRFLETVLNSMDDVLVVADPDGSVNLINSRGAELTGLEREKLLAGSVLDLFDAEEGVLAPPDQILDTGGFREFRTGFSGKDGVIPVSVNASVMAQSAVVYVARDMRETDALIRDLQNTRGELFRHERLAALGQVLGTVSHELRNPLATISASLFLLERTLDSKDPRSAEVIDRAARNIKRCERIIEELLDFSRVQEPRRQRENVDAWLRKHLAEITLPDGIFLTQVLDAPVFAEFDSDQLFRCLINIVQNATQALESRDTRGTIRIESKRVGDRIELEIHDNGPGISADDLDHVFEPLFSTKAFGVGLGLPMVRKTMQMHGGDVGIESEPGGGTTVRLWFPQNQE